jgi:hypothetical protein
MILRHVIPALLAAPLAGCGLLTEPIEDVGRTARAAAETTEAIRDFTLLYLLPLGVLAVGVAGEWLRRKIKKRRAAKACKP